MMVVADLQMAENAHGPLASSLWQTLATETPHVGRNIFP